MLAAFTFVFLAAIFATPFVLLAKGMIAFAILVAIYFYPSLIIVTYLSIKDREWPKVSGGPGITFAGKNIGF